MSEFVRPLSASVRVLVRTEGRPLEGYAVMLQVRADAGWQTIQLFDNAHGQHDLHQYTGNEKQPAERFMEGAARDVVPVAIKHLIDHWEAIIEAWKS